MKIQIQYGGHQVVKANNIDFLKRNNPILLIKTYKKPKQSKFVK